ncbi:MAG: DUF4405 domain-containing protein [Proteobacteria bacterium]|uniref:DUF4405 domain-containing protein n=1 Tax=Candidatus Avisuccinivibrio stercorigallinarum TaxID=2840704 RepID=A0A9D9GQK4_9GAMM|nr:DUF4405 domain-containing protein [Candidatus Avisuccinivibrio stercorigallinarum]
MAKAAGSSAFKSFVKRAAFFGSFVLLFVFVLAEPLTEVRLHEYAAVLFAVLIIWHLKDNAWFFKTPFSGLGLYALWRAVLASGLILSFVGLMVSGLVISQYVFAFLPLPGTRLMRSVHNSAAAYMLLFAGLHAGLHASAMLTVLKENLGRRACTLCVLLCALPALYGLQLWLSEEMLEKLSFEAGFSFFDYDAPKIYFFIDTLSKGMAAACVSALISRSLLLLNARD